MADYIHVATRTTKDPSLSMGDTKGDDHTPTNNYLKIRTFSNQDFFLISRISVLIFSRLLFLKLRKYSWDK